MPMTPEQERKLDILITMVRDLGTSMLAEHQARLRLERRLHKVVVWIRYLRDRMAHGDTGDSLRPPMPTLPDDTGSFEVSAMGARVKATGKVPIRIATFVLALAAITTIGYYVTHVPPHNAEAKEQKP